MRALAIAEWSTMHLDLPSPTAEAIFKEVEILDLYSNGSPLTHNPSPDRLALAIMSQLVQLVFSSLETQTGTSEAVRRTITDFAAAVASSTATAIRPTLAGHIWEYLLLTFWVSSEFNCIICQQQGHFSEPAKATQSFCDFFCHTCYHQYEIKSIPTRSSFKMQGGIKAGPYTSVLNNQLNFLTQTYKASQVPSSGYRQYDANFLQTTTKTIQSTLTAVHSFLVIVSRILDETSSYNIEIHTLDPTTITLDSHERGSAHGGYKTILTPSSQSCQLQSSLPNSPELCTCLSKAILMTKSLMSDLDVVFQSMAFRELCTNNHARKKQAKQLLASQWSTIQHSFLQALT